APDAGAEHVPVGALVVVDDLDAARQEAGLVDPAQPGVELCLHPPELPELLDRHRRLLRGRAVRAVGEGRRARPQDEQDSDTTNHLAEHGNLPAAVNREGAPVCRAWRSPGEAQPRQARRRSLLELTGSARTPDFTVRGKEANRAGAGAILPI